VTRQAEHIIDIPAEVCYVSKGLTPVTAIAAQTGFVEWIVEIPREVDVGRAVLVVHTVIGIHIHIVGEVAVGSIL
jgi:hypothetical protein